MLPVEGTNLAERDDQAHMQLKILSINLICWNF